MPQSPVAWAKVYKVGSGPFHHEITSLEDAEARMSFDSGDLSAIEDYEIRYIVTRTYQRPGIVGYITHTRVKVARPWQNEDSEYEFGDRMYPTEDF
jgi:hypothetical protein